MVLLKSKVQVRVNYVKFEMSSFKQTMYCILQLVKGLMAKYTKLDNHSKLTVTLVPADPMVGSFVR